MTRGTRLTVGAALVLSLAALTRQALVRGDHDAARRDPPAALDEVPSAPAAPPEVTRAPDPGAEAPAKAAALDPLGTTLESDDDATKIAAVEAAVRDGRVDDLPLLAGVELAREPASAPTIIHATASLGARGSVVDQRFAAKTLARWLREESRRDGKDAAGNVPNLVEALGDLGGREAVDALSAALDSGALDLSVETLAVQRLAALGDERAQASVARFAERAAAAAADDDFDRELRDEAIAAASGAAARMANQDRRRP